MHHPLSHMFALICAVLFSQAPEFAQQYQQRLGGAVNELAIIVRHFDEDAARSGYDRLKALDVMRKNSERLVRDQGTRMEDIIARLDRLREQQLAMKEAGPTGQFGAFLASVDGPLAQKTWQSFVPAAPFSVEGVLFAFIGSAMAYLLIFGVIILRRGASSEAEA